MPKPEQTEATWIQMNKVEQAQTQSTHMPSTALSVDPFF